MFISGGRNPGKTGWVKKQFDKHIEQDLDEMIKKARATLQDKQKTINREGRGKRR